MNKIIVKNIEINVTGIGDDDFIGLTDKTNWKEINPSKSVGLNWSNSKRLKEELWHTKY